MIWEFQSGSWGGRLWARDFQATQSISGLLLCRKHSWGRGVDGACSCVRWSLSLRTQEFPLVSKAVLFEDHNFWLMKSFWAFPETGCQLFYRPKLSWDWEVVLNNIIISVNTRWSVSKSALHNRINPEDSHLTVIWWLCLGIYWVLPSGSCSVSEVCSLKRPWTSRNYICSQRFYNLLHMASLF